MPNTYQGVTTRFLREEERLIQSQEKELPLVIEAKDVKDLDFLQQFIKSNSKALLDDLAKYGAILLRGFAITNDAEFEQTILSIPEFKGINNAFMAENGRVTVDNLRYVLFTNSVYKTGGTLYLGGFHTENYYSPDVPAYICFCCHEPSQIGGETGLINTEKLYRTLAQDLQEKLEKNTYFVGKWLVSEVAERYQISKEAVRKVCQEFKLPVVGSGAHEAILMYKPSVFVHPQTNEKALQINLFELPALNTALRDCFMSDYQGKEWFWHRFFWKLPTKFFNGIESLAVMVIALFNSPKNSWKIVRSKVQTFTALQLNRKQLPPTARVGSCFSESEVNDLAQTMRTYYSSCLWQKGDVIIVDNRKVMHAGMPGVGPRLIRAMIGNPIAMNYEYSQQGCVEAKDRSGEAIGGHVISG